MQLARQIIHSGEIGEVYHYRSQFLVSSSLGDDHRKSWRDDMDAAGAGALGDLAAIMSIYPVFCLQATCVQSRR